MTPLFENRFDAGRQLGERLGGLAGRPGLLVLGLPRGGVPVASEVAKALSCPLDVFVVRKLGVPGQEEFAMGAVASGSTVVIDQMVVNQLGISLDTIQRVAAVERHELARREAVYRGHQPYPDLSHNTVILVDDGVATGSSMLAALRAIRQRRPDRLVAAAPVMSSAAYARISRLADACVTLATPEPFGSVGQWYGDFSPTSDAEVLRLLVGTQPKPGRQTPGVHHPAWVS